MAELDEFQKLEEALIEAGRAIEYPRAPDLAAQVRADLENNRAQLNSDRPPQPDRARLRPAFVIAFAILAAIALLLIIPETREAIAQLLGLRTIRIIEATPTPRPPAATPRPTPTFGVVPFKQCCESTLAEAQQRADFELLLPPGEEPSRVFFQDQVFGRGSEPQQVVMVFGDPERPPFVLYQAHYWLYEKMLQSNGNSGTLITETQVSGQRALWLTGAPHLLVTLDRNGQPLMNWERPVNANTLIWEVRRPDHEVTYRLETPLGLDEAIEFAESLR
jgi:hypothetical protein